MKKRLIKKKVKQFMTTNMAKMYLKCIKESCDGLYNTLINDPNRGPDYYKFVYRCLYPLTLKYIVVLIPTGKDTAVVLYNDIMYKVGEIMVSETSDCEFTILSKENHDGITSVNISSFDRDIVNYVLHKIFFYDKVGLSDFTCFMTYYRPSRYRNKTPQHKK